MPQPTETNLTIDEFARLPDEVWRAELVRGRVVREPPAGMDHGDVANRIAFLITSFAYPARLGKVFVAETGFVLFEDPPTVRVPDVAFVSRSRLPSPSDSIRFGRMAPDLAVEIVSPSNTSTEILDKVADYLDAGTSLVWVIEPSRRCITEYRSRADIRLLEEGDDLVGYDVLPGFSIPVANIFADPLGD